MKHTTFRIQSILAGCLLIAGAGWAEGGDRIVAAKRQLPKIDQQQEERSANAVASAQLSAYSINWSSLNSGGVIGATSTNYDMGASAGQSVAGQSGSVLYGLDVGSWTNTGCFCPITSTGDVNSDGSHTSSDIIYLVNFVFKSGATPIPCEAAGDVNCSGSVTSADVIYMVNYVFKGAAPPCDACTLVCDGSWGC